MGYLIPTLEPLKGKFGSVYSLIDCKYSQDAKRKPILKFSIAVANIGNGPLHVRLGEQQNDNGRIVAPGIQRIHNDDSGYNEEDIGFFERHEHTVLGHTHVHWHYRDLASLDLVSNEQVISSSRKEGYCVVDSFKYRDLPSSPPTKVFFPHGCEQKTEIGISVGWADYYDFSADNEIAIENIPSGEYKLRFTINKTKMTYATTEPQTVEVKIDHANKKACVKQINVWPC
jgi:Lysyl oxidase